MKMIIEKGQYSVDGGKIGDKNSSEETTER